MKVKHNWIRFSLIFALFSIEDVSRAQGGQVISTVAKTSVKAILAAADDVVRSGVADDAFKVLYSSSPKGGIAARSAMEALKFAKESGIVITKEMLDVLRSKYADDIARLSAEMAEETVKGMADDVAKLTAKNLAEYEAQAATKLAAKMVDEALEKGAKLGIPESVYNAALYGGEQYITLGKTVLNIVEKSTKTPLGQVTWEYAVEMVAKSSGTVKSAVPQLAKELIRADATKEFKKRLLDLRTELTNALQQMKAIESAM